MSLWVRRHTLKCRLSNLSLVIHSLLVDSERAFTYTIYVDVNSINFRQRLISYGETSMSQTQYLKMLEKEIQKLNKKIDLKILKGEVYRKEARDHKLLLKKVRYHTKQSFSQRMIHLFFRKNIYA